MPKGSGDFWVIHTLQMNWSECSLWQYSLKFNLPRQTISMSRLTIILFESVNTVQA